MSTKPVHHLVVVHPDLPEGSYEVDLPWGSLPPDMQERLSELNKNPDRDDKIIYSPEIGGGCCNDEYIEVRHSDPTATALYRVLWPYAWAYPSNNRLAGDTEDRRRRIVPIQQGLFDHVVLSILGDQIDPRVPLDPRRWEEAKRVLSETGDFAHLYELGVKLTGKYNFNHDLQALKIAEDMFHSGARFASRVPWSRADYQRPSQPEASPPIDYPNLIETALKDPKTGIDKILDAADERAFNEETKRPYLLSEIGTPLTAGLLDLMNGGAATAEVAVPEEFIKNHPGDLSRALLEYYNREEPLVLTNAAFHDRTETGEFRLTAMTARIDDPGPLDDPIDPVSSHFVDQARLNRTVFKGKKMIYVHVGFGVPPEAGEAFLNFFGDRDITHRDVRNYHIQLRSSQGIRTIDKGFVIQHKEGHDSKDAIAGDIHLNDRDLEVVRVMTASIREAIESGKAGQETLLLVEELERFYSPILEQVTAMIEQWNEEGVERAFIAGDLADFVNLMATLEKLGFRGTNVRELRRILSQFEGALYVSSGNHDRRGFPFPLQFQHRGFPFLNALVDLYKGHYDPHRFSGPPLLNAVKSISLKSSRNYWEGLVYDALELFADDKISLPNDDFLDHLLRHVAPYENQAVSLGNGFRVVMLDTGPDNYKYGRYLLTEARRPLRKAVIDAARLYYQKKQVNGEGMGPEAFVYFLRELQTAQDQKDRGERVIGLGHFPAMYGGIGPDKVPHTVDSMRGDAAWAYRLAAWHFRRPKGGPVMVAALGCHVHNESWYDFQFDFGKGVVAKASEERFKAELQAIFSDKDPKTIYKRIHHFCRYWRIDNLVRSRSAIEQASDSFEKSIVSEFNQDPERFGQERGTLYGTPPAAGPYEPVLPNGYFLMTTHPDGRVEFHTRYLRVRYDGQVRSTRETPFKRFMEEWHNEDASWDRGIKVDDLPPLPALTGTAQTEARDRDFFGWDFLPLLCQYTSGSNCFNLTLGTEFEARRRGLDFSLGTSMLFALPSGHDRLNNFAGRPNYIEAGVEFLTPSNRLRALLGVNTGAFTVSATASSINTPNPLIGGQIAFQGILPLRPQVYAGGGVAVKEDDFSGLLPWEFFFGIRLLPTLGATPEHH